MPSPCLQEAGGIASCTFKCRFLQIRHCPAGQPPVLCWLAFENEGEAGDREDHRYFPHPRPGSQLPRGLHQGTATLAHHPPARPACPSSLLPTRCLRSACCLPAAPPHPRRLRLLAAAAAEQKGAACSCWLRGPPGWLTGGVPPLRPLLPAASACSAQLPPAGRRTRAGWPEHPAARG